MRLPLPGADGHLQYSEDGALDRASATTRLFPGTWLISKLNLIILIQNLWTHSGSLSKSLSWTKESTVYDPFKHESSDHSDNQRIICMPGSGWELISVWTYHCSVGDNYQATGWFSSHACFWSNTAPRSYKEASPETVVGLSGSNSAKVGCFVEASLTLAKACFWGCPQIHWLFLERRSLSGLIMLAKWGVNLLSWLAIPRYRQTSLTHVGSLILMIAATYSGSDGIPSFVGTWPRNFTWVLWNSYLAQLKQFELKFAQQREPADIHGTRSSSI